MEAFGWSYVDTLRTPLFIALSALLLRRKREHNEQISELDRLRTLGVWVVSPHVKKGTKLTAASLISIPEIDNAAKIKSQQRTRELYERLKKEGKVK